jgi:hypothetical protein
MLSVVVAAMSMILAHVSVRNVRSQVTYSRSGRGDAAPVSSASSLWGGTSFTSKERKGKTEASNAQVDVQDVDGMGEGNEMDECKRVTFGGVSEERTRGERKGGYGKLGEVPKQWPEEERWTGRDRREEALPASV